MGKHGEQAHGRGVPQPGPIADTVKTTTCYMCACRCGIRVHLTDGQLRYIEGNPDHPVNGGVICGKGAAGIMQQNSPDKLSKPLLRTGPRGSGQFKEISWEEALAIATQWLSAIRWSCLPPLFTSLLIATTPDFGLFNAFLYGFAVAAVTRPAVLRQRQAAMTPRPGPIPARLLFAREHHVRH